MQRRTKVITGIVVVAAVGVAGAVSILRARDGAAQVRTEVIERRDLEEIVTASGNIRARRTVDISSDVQGRVQQLFVDEGDDVATGQILLRLEPDQYEAALSRAEAALAQAQAQEAQQRANLTQAQRDLDRLLALRARDSLLVSRQQLDDAQTRVEVQEALVEAAAFGVSQARAGVDEAADRLSKTVFRAPMAGKVTRLNVEEGETVIIGTMNNPGSLVLTISDLSVIEVVVQVDETEVSEITLGDSAAIRIDAFPDRIFAGRVTEIGNSAINPPAEQPANQQAAIDFEVVLTLESTDAPLRPDLSATADIVVERRTDALSVPIIALTIRDPEDVAATIDDDAHASPDGEGAAEGRGTRPREAREDVEGVFIVEGGTVRFIPVAVGIAGREHFEVLSGLAEGDTVVAGPYQTIRQLQSGAEIEVAREAPGAGDG